MVHPVIVRVFFSLVLTCTTVRAAEIVVKNDTIPPGTPANEFEPGDRAGVRLTSPVSGTLVGVQIAWGSQLGGAAPSQEAAIRISEGGLSNPIGPTFYGPGATLATISSPILFDGVLNEFRFLDPATNLVPLSVPVMAGATYFVDLEFLSNTDPGPFGDPSHIPSILADAVLDGFDKNSFWTPVSQNWITNTLGLSGVNDFGIRAIVNPVPEPSSLTLLGFFGLALASYSWWVCKRKTG